MDAEFQALVHNETWPLVPPQIEMHIVSNKWVFRIKYKVDDSLDKYKAWLVAKVFLQTPGIDFFEIFNPVIKPSTIRVVFTLAMSSGWDIKQIDINNAFLNAELNEIVYMAQPKGFIDPTKPSHVCKLKKALYGLKQAPRAWFDKLKKALLAWGFTNPIADTSLFF